MNETKKPRKDVQKYVIHLNGSVSNGNSETSDGYLPNLGKHATDSNSSPKTPNPVYSTPFNIDTNNSPLLKEISKGEFICFTIAMNESFFFV